MRKYLIIGLGNPGKKYARTRHNVGQMVLDWLKKDFEIGERAEFFIPQTFMNQSGAPVMFRMRQQGIEPENLIVIHDDVDVEVGEYKIQKNRSSAGHKGVQSIINALGAQDFWRVRIGIGRPTEGQETDEFVLKQLPTADWEKIEQNLAKVKKEIQEIL